MMIFILFTYDVHAILTACNQKILIIMADNLLISYNVFIENSHYKKPIPKSTRATAI